MHEKEKKIDKELNVLINNRDSHKDFYGKHFLKKRKRQHNNSLTITSNYPALIKPEVSSFGDYVESIFDHSKQVKMFKKEIGISGRTMNLK